MKHQEENKIYIPESHRRNIKAAMNNGTFNAAEQVNSAIINSWGNDYDIPELNGIYQFFSWNTDNLEGLKKEETETKKAVEKFTAHIDGIKTSIETANEYLTVKGIHGIFTSDEYATLESYKQRLDEEWDNNKDFSLENVYQFVSDLLTAPKRRFIEQLFPDAEAIRGSFFKKLTDETKENHALFLFIAKHNCELIMSIYEREAEEAGPLEDNKLYKTVKSMKWHCRRDYKSACDYLRIIASAELYAARNAADLYGDDLLNELEKAIEAKVHEWGFKPPQKKKGKRPERSERIDTTSQAIEELIRGKTLFPPMNATLRNYTQLSHSMRNAEIDEYEHTVTKRRGNLTTIWTRYGDKNALAGLSVMGKKIFILLISSMKDKCENNKPSKNRTIMFTRDQLADRCYINISTKPLKDKFTRDLHPMVRSLASQNQVWTDKGTTKQMNPFSVVEFDGKTLKATFTPEFVEEIAPLPLVQYPEIYFQVSAKQEYEQILIENFACQYTNITNVKSGNNSRVTIKKAVEWVSDCFNASEWEERDGKKHKGTTKRTADRMKKALQNIENMKTNGKQDFEYEFYPKGKDKSKPIEKTTTDEFMNGTIEFMFHSITPPPVGIEGKTEA